jgi:medium-chain acyl-[acyl-carrier-protein] hydrolase
MPYDRASFSPARRPAHCPRRSSVIERAGEPTLVPLHPDGDAELILFPHAGGSSRSFLPWKRFLPPSLAVTAVELPGRAASGAGAVSRSMAEVSHSIARALGPATRPRFFYGHSLGGRVAFRTVQALRTLWGQEVTTLMIGAVAPTGARQEARPSRTMSDAELLKRVAAFGAMPTSILQSAALMQQLLPALRFDFELLDSDAGPAGDRLTCGLVVFAGTADPHCDGEIASSWRSRTAGQFALELIRGGHFFHQECTQDFLARLRGRLAAAMSS